MLENVNKQLLSKIEEGNITKKALITRTKQLEEDLEMVSQKVEVHSFHLGANTKKLDELPSKLRKYKKFCLDLRAQVKSSLAADEFLRDIVTDSEPRTPRDRRKGGQVVDSRLGKRPLGN